MAKLNINKGNWLAILTAASAAWASLKVIYSMIRPKEEDTK